MVHTDEAGAGVGTELDISSGPSIRDGNLRINEFEELAPLGVLSVGGAEDSVWHGYHEIAAAR